MAPKGERIRARILHGEDGVRLYGNRAFFEHLRSEVERIAQCPPGGHCEFQSLSLLGPRRGHDGVPELTILRQPPGDHALDVGTPIPPDAYDWLLMIVDDDQL